MSEGEQRLPDEKERDEAFAAGWRAERLLANPYKDETLARHYVDGFASRARAQRLGLAP